MSLLSGFSAEEIAAMIEFWKIRDKFFARNWADRDVEGALKEAAACSHPEAQWLTKVTDGKKVVDRESSARLFASIWEEQQDMTALAYASTIMGDYMQLRVAADAGHAFAQVGFFFFFFFFFFRFSDLLCCHMLW
jgi:hypothetical protein